MSKTVDWADVYKNFIGTHIQYSERELIKLEHEYELMRDKEAQQLIDDGFLDDIDDYRYDSESELESESSFNDDTNDTISNDISKEVSIIKDACINNVERINNENDNSKDYTLLNCIIMLILCGILVLSGAIFGDSNNNINNYDSNVPKYINIVNVHHSISYIQYNKKYIKYQYYTIHKNIHVGRISQNNNNNGNNNNNSKIKESNSIITGTLIGLFAGILFIIDKEQKKQ
mmetsp:Transcript_71356/g.87546  ORF Transcript_71356/g.87546 Transcript_71356/m.87546 type:complete len:231 (+) Transcript_71356:92-784(+)